LDKLLVKCGLAESGSEASRKIKEGVVKITYSPDALVELDGSSFLVPIEGLPAKLLVRLGKRIKIAVINR
jgi:tyrosyl-tRNA synthetase